MTLSIENGGYAFYAPLDRFAANKFSKQQHLQAHKPERPLQFFTKSLATVTMSSTY